MKIAHTKQEEDFQNVVVQNRIQARKLLYPLGPIQTTSLRKGLLEALSHPDPKVREQASLLAKSSKIIDQWKLTHSLKSEDSKTSLQDRPNTSKHAGIVTINPQLKKADAPKSQSGVAPSRQSSLPSLKKGGKISQVKKRAPASVESNEGDGPEDKDDATE